MARSGDMNALTHGQREVLRGLLQGSPLKSLAWALDAPDEEVLAAAYESLVALDPDAAEGLETPDRRRVCEYLLERQSPGQAAGTWALLQRSPYARRWAAVARAQLEDLYRGEPPALPEDEGTAPPRWGKQSVANRRSPTLSERRAARDTSRRVGVLRATVAQEMSPFRSEALNKHSEGQDRVKLPHYASRPARIALNVLAVALVAGIAFCALVEVPTYAGARVLVTSLAEDAPGSQEGISIVALFPADAIDDLDTGLALQVQLPGTEERVGMDLRYVEEDVLSPREIIDRYDIPDPQSRRVRDPAAVAVTALEVPDGAPPRSSFEGVFTEDADLRTGTQSVLSLLF
jgi:hypothetical protein